MEIMDGLIPMHGFVVKLGRYFGAIEQETDNRPFSEKYPKSLAELEECLAEGERLNELLKAKLSSIDSNE